MGAAGRRAQHDQVGRHRDVGDPLPSTRRSCSNGAMRSVSNSGHGVDGLPAGHPDLDHAELLEVARHGGLGGGDALAGEQVEQLRLVGHRVLSDQPRDRLLPLLLRGSSTFAPDSRNASAPGRVEAVVALLEHDAPRAVDHVGRHLEPR